MVQHRLILNTECNTVLQCVTLCSIWIKTLYLSTDQVQLDAQINKLRSELKVKVNNLRDMEFQSPVPGLMLHPLNHSELSAVGQVMGRHA
jgi:hypothetical protein